MVLVARWQWHNSDGDDGSDGGSGGGGSGGDGGDDDGCRSVVEAVVVTRVLAIYVEGKNNHDGGGVVAKAKVVDGCRWW